MTGRVEQGIVKTGEEVEVLGIQNPIKTTVTGAGGGLAHAGRCMHTAHPPWDDGCMSPGVAVMRRRPRVLSCKRQPGCTCCILPINRDDVA